MRSFLTVCLCILVCYVDKSYGTFADFLNNLPSEVASAFSSAWTSIADAIKKPVRIKRLGPGGRIKTTTDNLYYTTQATTTQYTGFTDKTAFTPGLTPSTTTFPNKLTLPLLPSPKFKTLTGWRDMQKAHYAKRKMNDNLDPVVIVIEQPENDPKGIPYFGDSSFPTLRYLGMQRKSYWMNRNV